MKIDIATRVVSEDEDIYMIRPGEGYWLYDDFKRSSSIFLDFPQLEIVNDQGKNLSDRQLRQAVVRSMDLAQWYDNEKQGPRPDGSLSAYTGKDHRRRIGHYVGAIKTLYRDLRPGTIVVVPGEDYFGEVLIGEIVGNLRTYSHRNLYDGEQFLSRKVKWLRSKQRGTFSDELRALMGVPTPLIRIKRSLREEVIRAGYDQYVFGRGVSARLNTEEENFSTLDDYNIQSFVNYVTGVLIAVDLGRTEKISFEEAIELLNEHPDLAMDLKLNINSKGFQRLLAENWKPLVAGTLLTGAVAMGASFALNQPDSVEIVNTRSPDNEDCRIEVQNAVSSSLALMYEKDFERVCKQARSVNQATGLSTIMSVSDDDNE